MKISMMQAKRALVLLAAVASLAACGDKMATGVEGAVAPPGQQTKEATAKPVDKADGTPAKADRVEVYYFHGKRRCAGCIAIQRGIAAAVEERLADETAAGKVVFREVDFDKPENRKLAGEFEVSFSTMVVAAMSGETVTKWENSDGVWKHGRDPRAMGDYVEERVRAHLVLLKGN